MSTASLQDILRAVPGKTIAERAKLCGVSRQNFHHWLNGQYGPNPKQAWKLAEITGYSIHEIIACKYKSLLDSAANSYYK